jgi:hypothetical protein
MSFIVEQEITLVALFSQNGFQKVKEGTPVDIVFDNIPGRIYHARVIGVPKGVGQGQVAVSGTLAKTSAIGGATTFPGVDLGPRACPQPLLTRSGHSNGAAWFAVASTIRCFISVTESQRPSSPQRCRATPLP